MLTCLCLFLHPPRSVSDVHTPLEQVLEALSRMQNTAYKSLACAQGSEEQRDSLLTLEEMQPLLLMSETELRNWSTTSLGPFLCWITLTMKKKRCPLPFRYAPPKRVWLHLLYPYLQRAIHSCLLLLRLKTSSAQPLLTHHMLELQTSLVILLQNTNVLFCSEEPRSGLSTPKSDVCWPEGNNCLPQSACLFTHRSAAGPLPSMGTVLSPHT